MVDDIIGQEEPHQALVDVSHVVTGDGKWMPKEKTAEERKEEGHWTILEAGL